MSNSYKNSAVIYNKNSLRSGLISPRAIKKVLKKFDIEPSFFETESEEDLDEIFKTDYELVIAAGGDGTVRGVTKRIVGKKAVLAIVPLGTANNFANSIGIGSSPKLTLNKLKDLKQQNIDIGKVDAPWGEDYFLEGMGFGLFADMLVSYRPDTKKIPSKAIKVFFENIAKYRSYTSELTIDDKNVKGDYVWVEILNTGSVGPRINIAKDADVSDGKLDVVRVTDNVNIVDLAISIVGRGAVNIPEIKKDKAEKISFSWSGFSVHIDGDIKPNINEKINYWYLERGQSYQKDVSGKVIEVTIKKNILTVLANN